MNHLELFRQIKAFVFDVDGVLTNNEVLVTEQGEQLRTMNIRDGLALKHAIQSGYPIAIITGGQSAGVAKRLQGLGIHDIYLGQQSKVAAFESFIEKHGLHAEDVLYMGDDLPDYPVMRRVGLAACPHDAIHELFAIAAYVSPYPGGAGCVRDVIEKVLRLQGKWVIY